MDDPLDHLFLCERGRVNHDRILRHGERPDRPATVARIAIFDLSLNLGRIHDFAAGAQLRRAATCPFGGRRVEVELVPSLREYNAALVAAFGNDVATLVSDAPLLLDEHLPNGRHDRDARRR
jgi:hypothetical protein